MRPALETETTGGGGGSGVDPAVRFCVRFSVGVAVLFAILFALDDDGAAPVSEVIAQLVAAGLGLFGVGVERVGTTLTVGGFRGAVVEQCTGLFETALLVAAIWAWEAPARDRLRGAVLGVAFLFLVNLVRVSSLMLIGAHAPGWFTEAHLYVWQGLLVATVGGSWLIWARSVRSVA